MSVHLADISGNPARLPTDVLHSDRDTRKK